MLAVKNVQDDPSRDEASSIGNTKCFKGGPAFAEPYPKSENRKVPITAMMQLPPSNALNVFVRTTRLSKSLHPSRKSDLCRFLLSWHLYAISFIEKWLKGSRTP
jgi:hypothetical protein